MIMVYAMALLERSETTSRLSFMILFNFFFIGFFIVLYYTEANDETLEFQLCLLFPQVSYLGEKSFDPTFVASSDKGLYEVKSTERHLVLGPLHPGTTYQISIKAKTSAGYGPAVATTKRTEIARE